jgi:hypothetical protein
MLVVLIEPEEIVEPTGNERRPPSRKCMHNKLILEGIHRQLGSKGRASQILEETIETVGPEANDYVILLWYIS